MNDPNPKYTSPNPAQDCTCEIKFRTTSGVRTIGLFAFQKERRKLGYTYASTVGSLLHALVCTRPDIAFSIGMLGRYQSNPGMEHWKAEKKIMRYLKGTKDYILTYKHVDYLKVVGYSNSNFASCQDSRKSTLGYVYLLAGGAISWKSAKETIIASSTMEAEFIACFGATSQAIWLRNFITGLRSVDSISRPLKVYCDNSAVVFFSNNNKSDNRSKHIDIKYLTVRDRIKKQEVSIEHISTDMMVVDPMTKGLSVKVFSKHVEGMGLIS